MDEPQSYIIPVNFKEAGHLFNGMIPMRNAIDAVIMALLGLLLANLLPFSGIAKLSASILFAGLLGMLGIAGLGGLPLSGWFLVLLRWSRNRKPKMYNRHGGAYTVSAAELMLQQTQLRDAVAGILDRLSTKMAGRTVDYVEGENFEFSYDPDLEALKIAQEQLEEDEAPQQKAKPEGATTKEKPAAQSQNGIDIGSILDGLDSDTQ